MIIVAVCATVALVAQAVALTLIVRMLVSGQEQQRTDLLAARRVSDETQAEERRHLADRVQQPERIPVAPMPNFLMPDQDDDELNLVGAILESDAEGDVE